MGEGGRGEKMVVVAAAGELPVVGFFIARCSGHAKRTCACYGRDAGRERVMRAISYAIFRSEVDVIL